MEQHRAEEHLHQRDARGRRAEKRVENFFKEIMAVNFPNLEKEKESQDKEAESFKEDKTKDRHTKTYYN